MILKIIIDVIEKLTVYSVGFFLGFLIGILFSIIGIVEIFNKLPVYINISIMLTLSVATLFLMAIFFEKFKFEREKKEIKTF